MLNNQITPFKYCTYLTVYSGNKLPPFYIGSSYIDNIKFNQYRGSVSSLKYKEIWKCEIYNNPNLFKTFILSYHRSRSEALLKERYFHQKLQVVNNSLYINRMTASDNRFPYDKIGYKHTEETKIKISKGNKGKKRTDEQKLKISLSQLGKPNPRKPLSKETLMKISESNKGKKRKGKALENIRNACKSEARRAKLRISNKNNTRSAKTYIIQNNINNTIVTITNLKKWCKSQELRSCDYNSLSSTNSAREFTIIQRL